jgi:hypothetical protein
MTEEQIADQVIEDMIRTRMILFPTTQEHISGLCQKAIELGLRKVPMIRNQAEIERNSAISDLFGELSRNP